MKTSLQEVIIVIRLIFYLRFCDILSSMLYSFVQDYFQYDIATDGEDINGFAQWVSSINSVQVTYDSN